VPALSEINIVHARSSCFLKIHFNFFILFIPCTADNQLTILSPTKCTILFPDIFYFSITYNTATCFDPLRDHHQGVTLKQHFTKPNQQSMRTIKIRKKVNQLKCRLSLHSGFWYTIFWRQPTHLRKYRTIPF
jgi:hypothetical protein